ncbi:MAG TPA: sialate O-acetylesterase [Parafilimonas sp.]|nr:sialate O-acetylesterase [Parafilimonas sp.]
MKWLFFIQFCFISAASPAQDAISFSVSNLLQNNMVIQQAKPMKIWGTARKGDIIKVKADWVKHTAEITADKNNEWLGTIEVPAAIAGNYATHTITIIHNSDTIQLNNILIGEVWLCSGQSNMDMQLKPFLPWLKGVDDFENEIAKADHPEIRVLDIATAFQKNPVNEFRGTWTVCTPQTAGDFSAVAYYFGLELLNKLHVPVGLVTSTVGGSSCQIWTSRETLAADDSLNKKYLYSYDTSAASKEVLDSVVTFEKVVRPTLFYNAMIYPLRNISLRGFLWYQGESNRDDGSIYTRLNIAMIKNWRALFNQGELPFYYVQVAPYNWQQYDSIARFDSTAFDYAIFREAQTNILKEKNTGIALTMDIAQPDELHPRDKKDVGIRLAKNAFAKTYGLKNIRYLGPQFSGFIINKNIVTVSFDKASVGAGLTTSDDQPIKYFFIAGNDKIFYPASAQIINDKVVLSAPQVDKPVAVRYAFTNYPITNFCNKDGLPAMPFRTDNWNILPSSNTQKR